MTLLLVGAAISCGPISPEPLEDEDGVAIPVPDGPFDSELRVVDIEPGDDTIGLRSQVVVRFDTYLDDDSLLDYAVISWRSGGDRVRTRVRYLMTEKALVATPISDLVPGLTYSLNYADTRLFSVTGAPLESQPESLDVFVDETVESSDVTPNVDSSWNAVSRIFDAKCNSCHADPSRMLPPLEHSSLVGAASEQVNKILVRPFDPADSYLMHKILDDYPYRKFTVQPPPWSDATPLTQSEKLTIELWITAGATK